MKHGGQTFCSDEAAIIHPKSQSSVVFLRPWRSAHVADGNRMQIEKGTLHTRPLAATLLLLLPLYFTVIAIIIIIIT
jgi:hypothetical protein